MSFRGVYGDIGANHIRPEIRPAAPAMPGFRDAASGRRGTKFPIQAKGPDPNAQEGRHRNPAAHPCLCTKYGGFRRADACCTGPDANRHVT